MFMKGELRRFIQRGLFLLAFVWGMSLVCPMEANAQLSDIAILMVEDQMFVENGQVKKTSLSDGKGGTIKYNEATNTLTIENYTFTKLGEDDNFITTYLMSKYKMFRIVLKGTNRMIRAEKDRTNKNGSEEFSIYLYDDTLIEGDGKLIANTAIGGGADYIIKDCDLEINGLHYGIRGENVTFDNANITLTTESIPQGETYYYFAALYVGNRALNGKLTIKNSVVKVKAGGQNWQSVLVRDNDTITEHDQYSKIVLSDDMRVLDETGKKLYVHLYDCWDATYYVYSKEEPQGMVLTTLNSSSKISQSVYFISDSKGKQVNDIDEVVNAINAIGTVTLNSKAQIEKARIAYNNLSSYKEETAYVKSKVYNYQTLVNAENTLDALQKQEETRIAKDAEEKAKKEQDKKESGQSGGTSNEKDNGNTNVNKPEKDININGVYYTVKTPKLKSVKSKKKKTVTLNWKKDKKSTGYQIAYSTNKNFKNSKTKTILIKNKKTKTYTIKKLKSKKTYYVRIRAYKTVDGKRHYGYWSQSKKIKIK